MFYPTYRLAVVGIVAVALLALYVVLYRTRIGMIVRAGIEDPVMVDSLGINVYRVFMMVFGIGAMAAGFAGIVNAPVVSLTPDVGEAILVQTFVVVVIGGVGSFPGAVLGGLIAGEIISITSMFNPGYAYVMLFAAMTLVLVLRPTACSARRAANERGRLMLRQRPFLVEILTAVGLIAAPFVLPYLGFAPNTVNRILVWGLFGIGFDILFGFTGLLSFGQSAFYGTGGFVAAYLLTRAGFPYVMLALDHRHDRRRGRRLSGRPDRAAAHRHLLRHDHGGDRGGVLLRRVQSAVGLDRRRERPARRADAELRSRLHHLHFNTGWSLYPFLAFCYFVGIVIALRIVRSPVGAILQRDPRQSAARRRRRPQHPRLQAHRLRDRRRLCRLRRRPARRDAGLHAAGRLHVRHLRPARDADRDRRRAARCSARWSAPPSGSSCRTSCRPTLRLGAAWKLVLGVVFVLLVCFLRRGIIGGIDDLYGSARPATPQHAERRAGDARRRRSRDGRGGDPPRDAGAPARRATAPCRADPAGDAA